MNRRRFNQSVLTLPWLLNSTLSTGQTTREHSEPKTLVSPVGMGTWITFDHRLADINRQRYIGILEAFFAAGGQMIDSSPMYGYAQQLLGQLLPDAKGADRLFSATKVWTMGQ